MQGLKVVLLLAVFIPTSLFAQDDQWYLEKPIADIRFEGLSSVSENELLGLIRPYLGQAYTDSLSWDIQSKLYALDYFDIIIPEIRPGDSGYNSAILVFQVQEKPQVDDVLFIGNSKVRRGELTDTVLIKSGDLLNPGALRIDEQAIIDYYLEKGFIEAEVIAEYTVDEQTNQASVVFTIVEGNQTKISDIRFVGNDKHVSDNTLQNLMKTKPQSLFSKGLFIETKLQEDLKTIERYYGDQGFINAGILDVNKEIIYDKDENLNKMLITIVIVEGEAWSYGGMRFNGNRIYTDAELEAIVLQQPGKTFSSTKFQMDYQRVSDLYFENGYIFNTFTYEEIRVEERREISYVVEITERDRAHIENIIIRGNDKTKSYIIRREIPLEEGEVFSKAKILEGVMNLYNLQYFDVVEPQPYPGSSDGLMDLVVDIAEGKTSDIGFGLSFSGGPDFPISGQLNWNDRNFLGRGQIVGGEVNISPDRQSVTLRFTEPRILGKRWSGGVDLSWSHDVNRRINQDWDGNGLPDPYNTWEEYDAAGRIVPEDYQMEYKSHYISTGFNTGYTWVTRLGRLGLSTGLRFTWEYVDYDPTVYRPHNQDIRENLENWKYDDNISLRLSWDTRDLQFDPTKGFILSENITFAGLLPVSRREYIKSVSRFNYNLLMFDIPVNDKGGAFKSTLYFNTAFQALFDKPWSDTIADRQRDGFYIDGMFVARGWDPSSGYRYLWDNTLQFKFPIFPNILAFDIFLDGVGAWVATNGQFKTSNALMNMHISDWRFTIGAGFRFANPQFPIGIYLVKKFQWDINGNINWNPEPDLAEFKNWGMDLVIAFNMDIY